MGGRVRKGESLGWWRCGRRDSTGAQVGEGKADVVSEAGHLHLRYAL